MRLVGMLVGSLRMLLGDIRMFLALGMVALAMVFSSGTVSLRSMRNGEPSQHFRDARQPCYVRL